MKAWIVAIGVLAFGATAASAQYIHLEDRDWDRRREENREDVRRAEGMREELRRLELRIQEYRTQEARREDYVREQRRDRWTRAEHPYEERLHEFCQQRGRQAAAMERDVAAGRSNHDERVALINLKAALDQQCGGYRFR